MEVLPLQQTRGEYLDTQIERSNAKFGYCKASARDVRRYRAAVRADLARRGQAALAGPILCLGTRNGREVDLFRTGFLGPRAVRWAVERLELDRGSFRGLVPAFEGVGRRPLEPGSPDGCIGVEINPRGRRPDVWVGSFDELPAAWGGRFGLLYSNSFDQSQDPWRTAREWRRVAAAGAYLVFCFAEDAEPSETDPVGRISHADVLELFGGELLFFARRGSRAGYTEMILRLG